MFGNAQMRWLALLLTIERMFRMFLPLKSFFSISGQVPIVSAEFM